MSDHMPIGRISAGAGVLLPNNVSRLATQRTPLTDATAAASHALALLAALAVTATKSRLSRAEAFHWHHDCKVHDLSLEGDSAGKAGTVAIPGGLVFTCVFFPVHSMLDTPCRWRW